MSSGNAASQWNTFKIIYTKSPANYEISAGLCYKRKQQLQNVKRKDRNKRNKRERKKRKESQAIERDFHIPEEKPPPSLLGLADFGLTIGADIADFIAITDGKVTFHRGHPHLVIKFLFTN